MAQNSPYIEQARRLGAEALGERGPRGMIALLELWSHWENVPPPLSRELLQAVAESRRVPQARRDYAANLLARASLRAGEFEETRAALDRLGSIRASSWQVIGPFDNEGRRGFEREIALETSPFDPDARYEGKGQQVEWRVSPLQSRVDYVDLRNLVRPSDNTCAFAATDVVFERAQGALLHFGAGGASKIWWNGEEVFADDVLRLPDPDRFAIPIGARSGRNRLLVKVCATDRAMGFYARIADPRGRPLTLRFETNLREGNGRAARPPRAPASVLERLREAAESARATPRDRHDYARYLVLSGADGLAEEWARQFSAQAAELEPQPDHAELAARLARHRYEAMGFVQRLLDREPESEEGRLLMAELVRQGLHPEGALPALDALIESASNRLVKVEAELLKAEILIHLELPRAARAIFDRIGDANPGAHRFETIRASAALAVGDRDSAIAHQEAAVQIRSNDLSARRALIADALVRRERERLEGNLSSIAAFAPDSLPSLTYLAGIEEAEGRVDDALARYDRGLALSPREGALHAGRGRILLRTGQQGEAIAALRQALSLRPQDAPTRELLAQISEEERPDERYAASEEELLARRVPESETNEYPLTMLQDLTVNTVFENGLGSSFRQIATQVHSDEGARQMRTYAIQYDPGVQRVDVRLARVYRGDERLEATELFEQQLGEPWYRVYYDTRALVLVFSDLEPGDIVELRWRVDDIAEQNLFADYYGDLRYLQGFTPIAHQELVYLTPESRTFHFNEPALEGLSRTEEVVDGQRRTRLIAENVAPLRSEPNMPGMTEVAPYLHVSTYRTWEEVGRWYWGLIADQLEPDESLRQTVRELVRGKRGTREKVIAIHDWVVEHTRYVGLEFGIHGYKPYRVPQIVSRGFGDCKDKASLLYAMFTLAGIDAHMILVRTRRNGQISDLPASLSVFDHAIAYVPELDLYIDGTAEQSGITELPQMDQGVTVLHVWPEGSELRRTPVLSPEQNRHQRNVGVRLVADGSAILQARETIRGAEAPSYRSRYEAEGTREERLERQLRTRYPGLRLDALEFSSLSDLESPVELSYAAEAPAFAQRSGDRLEVPLSSVRALVPELAPRASRRTPVDLFGTSEVAESWTLALPPGASVVSLPPGGSAESEFGTFSLQTREVGGEVRIEMQLSFARDSISPAEYPRFRAWLEEVDRLSQPNIEVQVQ